MNPQTFLSDTRRPITLRYALFDQFPVLYSGLLLFCLLLVFGSDSFIALPFGILVFAVPERAYLGSPEAQYTEVIAKGGIALFVIAATSYPFRKVRRWLPPILMTIFVLIFFAILIYDHYRVTVGIRLESRGWITRAVIAFWFLSLTTEVNSKSRLLACGLIALSTVGIWCILTLGSRWERLTFLSSIPYFCVLGVLIVGYSAKLVRQLPARTDEAVEREKQNGAK